MFLKKKNGLQKKVSDDLKKKSIQKIFSGKLQTKVFKNFFQANRQSAKFLHFKKLGCPRAEDRTIFENLGLRGQGLQDVSSKTPSLIIISSVEIRQENLSIGRVTTISGNFVQMASDSRLCGDFVQL